MGGNRTMGKEGTSQHCHEQTNNHKQKPPWTPDTAYLMSTAGSPLRFLHVAVTPPVAKYHGKQTKATKAVKRKSHGQNESETGLMVSQHGQEGRARR